MNTQEQLRRLADEAKQQPVDKKEKRKALSKLINCICRCHKLSRPHMGLPASLKDEIYQEGLQNLCLWLCNNIDKYDSERGEVIAWVNMLLIRRFYPEAARSIMGRKNDISVEASFWDNLSQEDLDSNSKSDQDIVEQFQKIRTYIEIDSKEIFRQAKMRSNQNINFQKVALKKIAGVSWKQMSEELNTPIPTLSNFYQRYLNKFRDELSNLV